MRKGAYDASKQLVVLRPKLTYEVSPQGLELSAEWWLDVHGAALQRLELDIDRRLTLLSVMAGDAAANWSFAGDDNDQPLRRVVLDFREPLVGPNRLLRLTAVGPLNAEPDWTLPNITAAMYMAFPRLPAIAEMGWTPQSQRQWETFRVRLAAQAPRWNLLGINYYRSPQVPW